MKLAKTIVFLVLSLGAVLACYAQAQVPTLFVENDRIIRTDPVSEKQTSIEFRNSSISPCDPPSDPVILKRGSRFLIARGQGDVCAYEERMRFFRYELYLKDMNANVWYRTVWNATPYGEISDGLDEIPITVQQGNEEETIKVSLPIHGCSPGQFISAFVTQDDPPAPAEGATWKVRLGSKRPVPLLIKNNLKDMQVLVQGVNLDYAEPEFWIQDGASLAVGEMKVRELQSKPVQGLAIKPYPLKALFNSFFRPKNGRDTDLNLTVSYAAQDGGNPKELMARIKVQFVPSLAFLGLAILIGVLLGTGLRLAEAKARENVITWLWSLGGAVLGAIVLELVGIFLISLNSEFKVFGLNLDPFQFLQVGVMAIVVGLFGLNIGELIKKLLKIEDGGQGAKAPQGQGAGIKGN